jgi:hypothetical protein
MPAVIMVVQLHVLQPMVIGQESGENAKANK